MMAMAISGGLCAPMLMPIGELIRPISASEKPASLRRCDALGVIALGAERADVEAIGPHRQLQRLVVDMADVRQRHHRRVGVETDLRDRVLRPFRVEADAGKARLRRERRARVDHHHLVAGELHQLRQDLADVRRADDEHARGRHQRMQEDLAVRRFLQLAFAAGEVLADVLVAAIVLAFEELAPAVVQAGPDHQAATAGAGVDGAVEQRGPAGLVEPLEEHLDLAAARQADLPGRFIRDAEGERLGLAVGQDVLGFGDDLAFHAAARHRSLEASVGRDHHLPADADRRRAPRADHGCQRHAAVLVEPGARRFQHVVRRVGGGWTARARTWLEARIGVAEARPLTRRWFASANINGGCAQHQRRRRRCRHAREDVRSMAVGVRL